MACSGGRRQAFVVVDMPFMSYQVSPQQAWPMPGASCRRPAQTQ